MKLHNFVICLLFGVILADDALEDVQTEFYLPYSATEDVDFSLSKPSGFGCYQWLVWLLKALQHYSIIQFRNGLIIVQATKILSFIYSEGNNMETLHKIF